MGGQVETAPGAEEKVPRICKVLDEFVRKIGLTTSWLNAILVIAIISNVVLRYVFGMGQVWLEEIQWHFYGIAVMVGLSYSQVLDSHIRVDILYMNYSERVKAFWNVFGICVFLLPWIFLMVDQGIDFTENSWRVREMSDSPIGLCCRYIPKAFIPISYFLLGIAAVSSLIKHLVVLFGSKKGVSHVA